MDARLRLSPSASILVMLVLVILLGWYSFPRHPLLLRDLPEQGGYDYFYFFATTRALEAGLEEVYLSDEMGRFSLELSQGRWEIRGNHPLPFYLLYRPLARLDFQTGYLVHLWLGLGLYAVGVVTLTRNLIREPRLAWAISALLTAGGLLLGPGVDNIWLGQIGHHLAFALAMTFVLGSSGRPAGAGFFLALAVLFKLYPALLALYYLRRGNWQTVAWMVGTLVILGLVSGLLWGFGHYANFLEWATRTGYRSVLSNQSLMGLLALLFGEDASPRLKVLNLLALGGVSAGLLAAGRRWGGDSRPRQALEFSAWVLASTILAPLSWAHHHLVLLLPLLAFAALAYEDPENRNFGFLGMGLVCLTWFLEGEVVTRDWIRTLHYQVCLWRIGLAMLSLIMGACLVGMARTAPREDSAPAT
jgi:hypothetical protein